MTMGTASTMTALTEALGLSLPGSSSVPAMDAAHSRVADLAGRRIVEMVWEDLKPSDILSTEAFLDAVTVDMAIGGSTNAMIHLVAMAARAGIKLDLDRFDQASRLTPVIANLRPSGQYLMEDFYFAGGLRALLGRMKDRLHLDRITVTGKTLGENLEGAEIYNDDVIRPLDRPLAPEGGTFVLRGNLAPQGAVIKVTAADPKLLKHRGPAVVFSDVADLARRIDSPDLAVTPDSVLLLRNAGPVGGPGMPEWGMLPIPKKLLDQGIRDMVRISDARMSGTSYGTCVLHVDPEGAVGGPIALVRDGDPIELDAPARRLHLDVSDSELARRRAEWKAPPAKYLRGFGQLFLRHVTQAHLGCDFDFLAAREATPDPEIY
jgi:dihydroxy-acid dehydratase